MSLSISGKTAIVTGGANGIGLAIGRHFADAGANVVFADQDEARLKEEFGEVEEDSNIRWFAGDLRKKLTIANLLSVTIDSFERVDILVNASRQILQSDPLDPKDKTLATMLDQNLLCSLQLSQLVAKRMMAQGEEDEEATCIGSIVNLSSTAAFRSHPELLAYSISTAALNQMTRSLALALADKRIRVNAVAFASVMSASLQDAIREDEDIRSDVIAGTPMGRIASPGEVADAVQYLCSEGANFTTGEIMVLDGGRHLLDPVRNPAH